MRKTFYVALVTFLAACQPAEQGPPIVVLAPDDLDERIATLLDEYTVQTGVPIEIETGESAAHADRLIAGTGASADVLITNNAIDIWRAAEEGALRPIKSAALAGFLPAWKDPDRLWAAVDQWPYLLVYAPGQPPPDSGFAGLSNPVLKGRVCLTSSYQSTNRALIGFLIEDLDVRPAERLVRGWVRNLGQPPFDSQDELLDALRGGQCDYGILVARANPEGLLSAVVDARYSHIHAIGVARHAKQAERAQAFVGWVLERRTLKGHFTTPPLSVGISGWRDEEARLLAERAGYW